MVGAVAVLVNSVLSPVVDIDITQTTHQQLHGDTKGSRRERQQTTVSVTSHLRWHCVKLNPHCYIKTHCYVQIFVGWRIGFKG